MISRAANSPILLPLDTSSRVYVGGTLGPFCNSGTQSLTGLKLILLCEIDARVPSLPICSPSMELTRLNDIVERPPVYYDDRASTIGPKPQVDYFSNWQRDQRSPIGFANLEAKMCGDRRCRSLERGRCKDLQTENDLNDIKSLLTCRETRLRRR